MEDKGFRPRAAAGGKKENSMKYRIISVGKIRENHYRQGINEYLKRLRAYTPVELVEGLEEKVPPRAGDKEIANLLNKEAGRILNLVTRDDRLVLLDLKGQTLSSVQLAGQINSWNTGTFSRVNFIIGGPHGVDPEIKKRGHQTLALSALTLPHQMAVLVLCEQLYRSFRIIRGEPYHR